MGKFIDITGQRFGKLTVIKKAKSDKRGEAKWLCKCDCGNITIVLSSHIRNYRIRSCGCLFQKNKFLYNSKYGNLENYQRLYNIYNGMRARCYNINCSSYKYYGGRGIKICNEWLEDFFKFMQWSISNGYKDDLSIDRIDVNGNYEPSNCRWITMEEQENNKRDNIFIKYKNEIKTLKQWSKILKIPYGTVYNRYSKKFNVDDILSIEDLRSKKK